MVTPSQHDHTFGQDKRKPGELRTLAVVLLTASTMVLEIVAGLMFGSMALLADGLHMASHATALTISMAAYVYARRYANDDRFSFGTGKVNSLAGFAGAILLAGFATVMAWESVVRLVEPVPIAFDRALIVAVIGLLVNGVSVFILGHDSSENTNEVGDSQHGHFHEHDHNLRSAYLHVLADALTSFLAIFALLAGKYAGLHWLDPVMGIVGAILVARWSFGLLKTTAHVLLDRQASESMQDSIRRSIQQNSDATVVDLHVWQVGPGIYCLILSVVTAGGESPDDFQRMLPTDICLVHVSIEVHPKT